MKAFYVEDTRFDGIPVRKFSASLGDMSQNDDEKCYCLTPDTCLKKGMMDLYKCNGVPIYASLPHFYDCDESYLKLVDGLKPNKTKHSTIVLFEWVRISEFIFYLILNVVFQASAVVVCETRRVFVVWFSYCRMRSLKISLAILKSLFYVALPEVKSFCCAVLELERLIRL